MSRNNIRLWGLEEPWSLFSNTHSVKFLQNLCNFQKVGWGVVDGWWQCCQIPSRRVILPIVGWQVATTNFLWDQMWIPSPLQATATTLPLKNLIRFLYISFLDSTRYEMLRWGLLESYGVMWTNNSARDSRVNDPPVVMQIDSASAYKPVNLVYTTPNNEYMQTNTNPTDIKNRTKHM